jgi:hypothetical protein
MEACGVLSFKVNKCILSEHTTHACDDEFFLNCFLHNLICFETTSLFCTHVVHNNYQTYPMMTKLWNLEEMSPLWNGYKSYTSHVLWWFDIPMFVWAMVFGLWSIWNFMTISRFAL